MAKKSSPARVILGAVGTPLTITTSVVVGVSGLMLFFKVGTPFVKGLHEWVSLVMVAACALHVIRNWGPIVRYARQRALWVATGLTALATVALVLPAASGNGGHPDRRPGTANEQVVRAIENAPLEQVAKLAGCSTEELTARLAAQGMTVPNASMTVEQVAKSSNRPTAAVLHAAFGERG